MYLRISGFKDCMVDLRGIWLAAPGLFNPNSSPGAIVSSVSSSCPNATIVVRITGIFLNDRRTPLNPRDDQYCSIEIRDSFKIADKINPVIRPIYITTADTIFSISHLKSFFTSTYLSDNCSPLSVLQGNLELRPDPRRPAIVRISCGSPNTFIVAVRTRDACGNFSTWVNANVQFIDDKAPMNPILYYPLFYLNSSCRFKLTPNTDPASIGDLNKFSVLFTDDHTPRSMIRYSHRILSPAYLRGNIPASGLWIDRSGYCPASLQVTVRVCAQDCFGNGSLYLDSDSEAGVGTNCRLARVDLIDTTPPIITSVCGLITKIFTDPSCQAIMPNLTPTISIGDNCSSLPSRFSIFQIPAPGSILNDGIADNLGYASGPITSIPCTLLKQNDDVVLCSNSSNTLVKYVHVSFILVDCDTNCRVVPNCQIIKLSTPDIEGLVSAPTNIYLNEKIAIPKSQNVQKVSLSNYPNPFNDFTEIKVNGNLKGQGIIQFYNLHGQKIYSMEIDLNADASFLRVDIHQLNTTGLIFYSLELKNNLSTDYKSPIMNKMVVF